MQYELFYDILKDFPLSNMETHDDKYKAKKVQYKII